MISPPPGTAGEDLRTTGDAAARTPRYWALQNRLGPDARRRVRRVVDRLAAPVAGSVRSFAGVPDAVALTFDDGPDPAVTYALLDVLARYDSHATFFFLLGPAERHPDAVRAVVQAGHEVGLHGIDHTRLTTLPPAEVRARLRDGKRRLEAVAGTPVRWFRPPFGAQSLRTYVEARRAGLAVVAWAADAADWEPDPVEVIAHRGLQRLEPGTVLLLHERLDDKEPIGPSRGDNGDSRDDLDGPSLGPLEAGEPTGGRPGDRVAVAEMLLQGLAARGWQSRTVGQLTQRGRTNRTAWFRP